MEGFLLLNKPIGLTSAVLLNRLKRFLKESGIKPLPKIGHGGTLDKSAQGLLVVGLGRNYTKQLHSILKDYSKTYHATLTLGATSSTDDSDGQITKVTSQFPDLKIIKNTLKQLPLNQPLPQTAPLYSAQKIDGQRLSDLARQATPAKPKTSLVTIFNLKLNSYQPPLLNLNLAVSAGFYIRALARDLGQSLKTGAYLSSLTRTQIGPYSLNQATTLDTIKKTGSLPLITNL